MPNPEEVEPVSTSLARRLLLAAELDPETRSECSQKGPLVLLEIIPVINQIKDPLKQQLRELAQEEKWLLKYAENLNSPADRQEILLAAWPHFCNEQILSQLVDLLQEEQLSQAVLGFLCHLADPALLPYLLAALLQPQYYKTEQIAQAFLPIGPDAANLLARLLLQFHDAARIQLLAALAAFGPVYQIDNLLACLAEGTPQVRRAAAAALGSSRQETAAQALLAVTYDQEAGVRQAAATALGNLGLEGAQMRLTELLTDEDSQVRQAAIQAIQAINSGQLTN
ncbi:MAG: HEAT repeat domain-containing protein [Clostridiales bacterium]|jgi:hypothetical protein|nr:HEAT repeat domain-containing protein [Clostridiales bacterium]